MNNQTGNDFIPEQEPIYTLDIIKEKFQENRSKEEILEILHQGLTRLFDFSGVAIYLLDPATSLIDSFYPNDIWPLPEMEKKWLIKRTRDVFISGVNNGKNNNEQGDRDYIYVKNRSKSLFSDREQIEIDRKNFDYDCNDLLYWVLTSEEEILLGIVCINNWARKNTLLSDPLFSQNLVQIRQLIQVVTLAIDNLFVNKKIESLLTDKQHMKERIQKEEEDLKNRILELSVLYDTSTSMGHSINYYQIITLLQDAVYKVLRADLCTVFLMDMVPGGEMFLRVNSPIPEDVRSSVQSNILAVITSFIKRPLDRGQVNFNTEETFDKQSVGDNSDIIIQSFMNVPLIFKDELIGLLNICSTTANAFAANEITFLHTIANQLAVNIGRLKIVKAMEKSKIGTMVASMAEGVIMLDENNHLETINPAAKIMLNFEPNSPITTEILMDKFTKLDLISLYYDALASSEAVLNRDIALDDKILSANVTPVMDLGTKTRLGMVMVLRDVTELQNINKIKTQRLEIISRVNLIINSITDVDNLLTVLMEFVLSVANAEMGSIQLKENNVFHTKIHSNFPDKISRDYFFTTGELITDQVIKNSEIVFIENYPDNETVNHKTKVLIDYFLSIPIMVKNDLIGVVNIIKKKEGNTVAELSLDDIQTLTTITSLSGAAIYNALLYQETLKKEKIDQELRVAHEIQNRLLPQSLPKRNKLGFGAISFPARAIGGDYYDFFNLESGKLGIVVADIVGKGIPAALFMVMVKSIMQTHVTNVDSPAQALKEMNSLLYKDPVFNKYVPLFYAVLNPDTFSFKYSNAGHEPGLIFSGDAFIGLDTEGTPLGAWEDVEYEEKEIILKDGDIIALFTDGITEARNIEGEDYGIERVKEQILRFKHLGAKDLIEAIYNKINEFCNEAEQHDDLTMVVVKADFNSSQEDCDDLIESKEIKVLSSKKNIVVIRENVDRVGCLAGLSEEEVFNLKLVINEAQANIIEHAYHGDEHGEIIFKFFIYKNRLEIMIKDFGKGIDTRTIKGEKHLDELEGSGLGVYLINKLMDKVEYRRTENVGTELWLTKYRQS